MWRCAANICGTYLDCVIISIVTSIYLTSSTSKGFWNFSEKQLLELKNSKTNRGFVIVFLMASEYGYLIHGNDIDNHTKDFSFSKEYYKIKEEYLRTTNIPQFRSVDAFLDLLKRYQVQ